MAAGRLTVLEARIAAQVAVRDRLATALRQAGVSAHASAADPPHQATGAQARTVA
ncbi:hypothetical protein [Streptomyces massasporeus]|uniref:hypothetical protein n=1 Tax=Streptomyces massasporeus TaxID=67324 RepID=UPI003674660C